MAATIYMLNIITEYSYNIRPFMMMYTYNGEPQSNICSTKRTCLPEEIYWKLSNDVSKIPIPLDNDEIRDYVKRKSVELI
jgi:hypothetical protein